MPGRRSKALAAEDYLAGNRGRATVRPLVADSWRRSAAAGVAVSGDPAPITMSSEVLAGYRAEHPLSRVFPLLYDVLGRAAEECDSVLAVADAHGQLLWVSGPQAVLRRAERIHFVEGARWDEEHAGTNAPGTALRLDAPVTIHAAEHFARPVRRWSCVAAPVHDPVTAELLGVLDITGGAGVGTPQTSALVRAAARLAESELGRLTLLDQAAARRPPPAAGLRVAALGRPDCVATIAGRSFRLSPRHSEILVLLASRPDGLSGDELAAGLYSDDHISSTVRAELLRLRTLLGADLLTSRPYRLVAPVESDWAAVRTALAGGDVGAALRHYAGPLLPQSDAPGIRRLRDRLAGELRAAVLAAGSPDLLAAWTRTRWGGDDLPMWQAQLGLLPAGSALRPLVAAECDRLEAELGYRETSRSPADNQLRPGRSGLRGGIRR